MTTELIHNLLPSLHHAGVAFTEASLLAQRPAGLADEGGGLLPLAIAVGVSILICFPGFLNPKRSHEK